MSLGRETILAGVVGFAIGLLAAWAVWNIPKISQKKGSPPTIQEKVSTPPESFFLSLTQPEEGVILTAAEASVSGKTENGATVIVSGPLEDKVIEATANGTFSATVGLEEGANEIVVTAYPPTGEAGEKTETRTVNFTKEEF